MKKILFYTPFITIGGGVQKVTADYVNLLTERGYEVHIACGITDKKEYLESLGFIVHPISISRSGTSVKTEIKTIIEIYKIIKSIGPHVLEFFTIKPVLYGGIVSRFLKIPKKVFYITGLGYVFIAKGLKGFIVRNIVKMLYKLAISGKNSSIITENIYDKELSLNDKVYLLGKKENPFAYISKANCFVFASNHEGFPNVLVEALACGLPVITTDCKSGPREILAPKSDINFQLENNIELAEYGILTPIKNVEKLKEGMDLMINDKDLKKDYEEKAKNRANDFRIDKIIKQYERILCVE